MRLKSTAVIMVFVLSGYAVAQEGDFPPPPSLEVSVGDIPSSGGSPPPEEAPPPGEAPPGGSPSPEEVVSPEKSPPIQGGEPPGDKPSLEPQGLLVLLQPFNYDAEGRRDPFAPYKDPSLQTEEDRRTQLMGPVLPFAKWGLEEIKLVAVRLNADTPRAMFMTPDNKKFTLGKGERIGRNNGYIGAIRAEEVIVIESVMIRGESRWVTRVIRLRN